MVAAAGRRRRRCAAAILLVLPVVAVLASSSAAADGSFITWDDLSTPSAAAVQGGVKAASGGGARELDTIVVAQDGTGHSRTVQGAVDMVPAGNSRRVKILVRPGVYREKVTVPITKPFVSLIGMGSGRTVITWNARASDMDRSGHQVGTFYSASVAVEADYFCASHITFENSAPAAPPGAVGQQAVALRLSGDKTMLYRCRILGTQDTLFDNIGRHFLYNCDIQGSIDFIFGNARSLYQDGAVRGVQLQGPRGEHEEPGALVPLAHLRRGAAVPRPELHQRRAVAQAVDPIRPPGCRAELRRRRAMVPPSELCVGHATSLVFFGAYSVTSKQLVRL
ncbi:pectinesterase QRT1 isoform X2 [Zea mays]|uniref:Pectinesterase n=1 Tax=Zea mays TaxID=4577 RepID=A0A804QEU7_MAIZE|nr:pectinesterase QRT1 isoform X2 [Zea mays]|eukprot:XP_008653335.1 pectinesterase QRT1 isoform X2 [Zea mays]